MRLNPRAFNGKMSDGDIRLLRVFCAVVRCGGFAAAESELQLGLPSISRYIKDLETRLGVRLCRRGRVGFSLTDQGRQVYSSSLQLIADLERFEANIRSIHADLTGTLNIGIIDTLITDSSLPIPEILRTYKRKHPFVEYNIITATSNVIEQSVLDGNLHAGLVIGRRHINQLDYRFLYRENCNMYCSEDHPLFDGQDRPGRFDGGSCHADQHRLFPGDAARPFRSVHLAPEKVPRHPARGIRLLDRYGTGHAQRDGLAACRRVAGPSGQPAGQGAAEHASLPRCVHNKQRWLRNRRGMNRWIAVAAIVSRCGN